MLDPSIDALLSTGQLLTIWEAVHTWDSKVANDWAVEPRSRWWHLSYTLAHSICHLVHRGTERESLTCQRLQQHNQLSICALEIDDWTEYETWEQSLGHSVSDQSHESLWQVPVVADIAVIVQWPWLVLWSQADCCCQFGWGPIPVDVAVDTSEFRMEDTVRYKAYKGTRTAQLGARDDPAIRCSLLKMLDELCNSCREDEDYKWAL